MCQNSRTIVSLIQQDLKYHQIMGKLAGIGFHCEENHRLELIEVVAELMHVNETGFDAWGAVYSKAMQEVNCNVGSLELQANECYKELLRVV